MIALFFHVELSRLYFRKAGSYSEYKGGCIMDDSWLLILEMSIYNHTTTPAKALITNSLVKLYL